MFKSVIGDVASITPLVHTLHTLTVQRGWFEDAAARVMLGDGVLPVAVVYRGMRKIIGV